MNISKLQIDPQCLGERMFHMHLFFYSGSPVRFSTLKKRFPLAHIEKAYGSVQENRDYISKKGKWTDTRKAETSVEGSFEEAGHIPSEKEERFPAMSVLLDKVDEGAAIRNIIEELPSLALKVKDIEVLQDKYYGEQFLGRKRNIYVTYIWGVNEADKLYSIYKEHGFLNVCRVTNYREKKGISFDTYRGHSVLVFDNFRGQIPLQEMLTYLDCYPLTLPARYGDRIACYMDVYIVSDLSPDKQYSGISSKKARGRFLKKLDRIVEYKEDGTINELVLREREVKNE